MKKNLLALSIAAVLAASSMVASAAAPDSFYVGLRGGYSHTDWDNTDHTTLVSDDNSGYGVGVYAGYNFNEYFALEGGYNYFPGFGVKSRLDNGTADLDYHGPELTAKVSFPMTNSFDLFVRGGLMYAFGDMSGDAPSSHKIAPLIGGGAEVAFTRNFGMRVGYDRYFNTWDDDGNDVDHGVGMDVDFAYVGLQYTFGSEPAPAPAPVTKTVTTSYSLDSNTLFAFDKSELTPEGNMAIDQILSDVATNNMADTQYSVVGHTDRLGAEDYNQRLSEKRAQVVADALVAKGVPAGTIMVEGRGESEPVTGDKCDGLKRNDLIVCYGPDRRVDIHVTGNTTSTETTTVVTN